MNRIKQPWRYGLALAACFFVLGAPIYAQDDTGTGNSTAATNNSTNETSTARPSDDGRVQRGDVVQIGSSARVAADEEAGDVIAVMGSCNMQGTAHGDVVAVFGDVDVNGEVEGNAVSVFGIVRLGPKANVRGDAVSVGQHVERESGGKVHGRVQETGMDLPGLGNTRWLTDWLNQCVFRLRPLSPHVGWVWGVAGMFFLIYVLIAAAFPHAVRASMETLRERPVTTLAVGIFANLGLAIIYLLLAVTLVGILVIPFVQVAAIVALLVGKVAIMELIGGGVGGSMNARFLQRPFLAFLLGALIVTLIYMIPVLGLLTFFFISAWGFGAATVAAFARYRRERPPKAPTPPPTETPRGPVYTMPLAGVAMGAAAAAHTPGQGMPTTMATTNPAAASVNQPVSTAAAPVTPPLESATAIPSAPPSPPTPSSPEPSPAPFVAAVPLTTGLLGDPATATSSVKIDDPPPSFAQPVATPPLQTEAPPPSSPPPPSQPYVAPFGIPAALANPRAGFWLRMAAGALDLVLLIIIGHFSFFLFVLLAVAYFTVMLGWKGTTIGGIILRLHVVRADGQPLSFLVALVRALAGVFSVIVLFLGFFWIAWDPDKQGWHDKLAGTVVVRVPTAPALVML